MANFCFFCLLHFSFVAVGSLSAERAPNFQDVKANGDRVVAVSGDRVFLIDPISKSASEMDLAFVKKPEFVRWGLRCSAWFDESVWLGWTGRRNDRSLVQGVSRVDREETIVFNHTVIPHDLAFADDGSFYVLGIDPASDHLVHHFDSDGVLLNSFLPKGIVRERISDVAIFWKDGRVIVVLPWYFEAYEFTRDGQEVQHYELMTETTSPRSAFQGPDGTVYVELISGVRKVINEEMVYVNPEIEIVALREGRVERVTTIPSDQVSKHKVRALIRGRFLAPLESLTW